MLLMLESYRYEPLEWVLYLVTQTILLGQTLSFKATSLIAIRLSLVALDIREQRQAPSPTKTIAA